MRRISRIRIVPLAALFIMAASSTPALCGYTSVSSPLEEIVERQSLGLEAALLGDHMVLGQGQQSVALHPFFGGYGEDGIMAGLAASWHTTKLLPWEVGVNASAVDADVQTWQVGISVQRQVWQRGRLATLLQGCVAYQALMDSKDNPTSIYLDQRDPWTLEDEVLLDTFTFGHAVVNAVVTADLQLVRTILDLSWVGTAYHFDAFECDRDCFETGAPRGDGGRVSRFTWGLAASLGLRPAILSGGFKVSNDAAIFQITVGVAF